MDPTTALFVRYREHGDVDALGRVFDQLASRLLALALHACGNAADAEDALQATFVVAMKKAATFDNSESIGGWLAGILAGEANNLRRREQRRRGEPLVEPATADGDPIAASERRELVAQLRTHVEALPEEQRQVVLLQLQHGLQPAEIAEVLRVPPGTVRMRLHRGLAALRGMLPAGLAALVTAMLPARGLAAVRAAVMGEATAAVAAGSSVVGLGAIVLGGALMKKLFAAVAALALLTMVAWPLVGIGGDGGTPIVAPAAERVAAPLSASTPVPGPTSTARSQEAVPRAPADALGDLLVVVRGDRGTPDGHGVTTFCGSAGSGSPMVDACVELWSGSDSPEDVDARRVVGRTDWHGQFTAPAIPPGDWRVAVTAAGRRSGEQRVVVRSGDSTRTEVHLPMVATVVGRVVDADGAPVAAAELWAGDRLVSTEHAQRRLRRIAITAADGTFCCDLLGGERFVHARKSGHAASWSHPVEQLGDGPITLTLGNDPGRAIVRVAGSGAAPMPGARVHVQWLAAELRRDRDGALVAPPLGQAAVEQRPGTFIVDDLPAGIYECVAQAPGRMATTHIQVQAGATATCAFEMVPGVRLSGHVRDEQGRPRSRVYVTLLRGDSSRGVRTDSGGGFRLEGIEAGPATVYATSSFGQAEASVMVSSTADVVCDFVLVELPTTRGRVVDSKGRGVGGVQVAVVQGGTSHLGQTDELGAFEVSRRQRGPAAIAVTHGDGSPLLSKEIDDLDPQQPLELVLLAAPGPAVVSGRVVAADGSPIPSAWVELEDGPPSWGPSVDAAGSFRLESARHSQQRLLIEADGFASKRLLVDVTDGERSLGDVVLLASGELRVRCLRPDGTAWRVRPPIPTLAGERVPTGRGGVAWQVAADGIIVLTRMPEGRYTVRGPDRDELIVEPAVVDVAAGRVTELVLPTAIGRRLLFCVEEYQSIASAEHATLVVRRSSDGCELARGYLGPAGGAMEVILLVPLCDLVAEVLVGDRVTHRVACTAMPWGDRGIRTIPPLPSAGK